MIVLIVFILLLILGVPVAFVLLGSGMVYMLTLKDPFLYLLMVPQRIFGGMNSYALLAVPFFILAGELMNQSGITQRLIKFATLLVGSFVGGLAHVNIIASFIFGGISGSAVADVSSIGSILIPAMVKEGYDLDFSTAVTISSSLIGPIVPPSIPMIVYAYSSGISVASMFLAGYIPGALIAISLMIIAYILSLKRKYPIKKIPLNLKNVREISLEALPAIVMPIFIIVGILSGIFTATEAAVVAVAYALIIGFIFRTIRFSDLPKIVGNSVRLASITYFVIAGGNVFGWVLTSQQIPQKAASIILSLSISPIIFLILIHIFLLMVGMFLDLLAATVILVPILLPIALQLGVNPLHFGMVFCLSLIIGLITPPVGLCLFVASGITGLPIEKIFKSSVWFLTAEITVTILIIFFPQIVLFLPKLFDLI